MLSLSGNFIPRKTSQDVRRDLEASVKNMILDFLFPLHGTKVTNNMKNWPLKEVLNSLDDNSGVSELIREKLRFAARKYERKFDLSMDEEEVLKVKRYLSGWIVSPRDKNNNFLCVM